MNPSTLLKTAAERLSALEKEAGALREEKATLETKVAAYERERLAEEIALMMAAAETIEPEEILDKRAELAAGEEDLGQLRQAMRRYGPGKVAHVTVAADLTSPQTLYGTHVSGEPAHVAEARQAFEQVVERLFNDD